MSGLYWERSIRPQILFLKGQGHSFFMKGMPFILHEGHVQFYRGHFHYKNQKVYGNLSKGAPRPRPRVTEAMAFAAAVKMEANSIRHWTSYSVAVEMLWRLDKVLERSCLQHCLWGSPIPQKLCYHTIPCKSRVMLTFWVGYPNIGNVSASDNVLFRRP